MEEFDLTGDGSYAEALDLGAVAFKLPSKAYPKGRRYVFHSPPTGVGLQLQALIHMGQRAQLGIVDDQARLNKLVLNEDEEFDLYRAVMGDTLELIVKDEVPLSVIQDKVLPALFAKYAGNQPIQTSLDNIAGEAAAQPNRAARRASAKSSSPKAGSKSSRASSGTAARTTGRASTPASGTSAARRVRAAG